MTLSHEEFIRRFTLHILPKRFVKIRHYGFLSSTWKRQKLKNLQQKKDVMLVEKKEKELVLPKCPACKTSCSTGVSWLPERRRDHETLAIMRSYYFSPRKSEIVTIAVFPSLVKINKSLSPVNKKSAFPSTDRDNKKLSFWSLQTSILL